MIACAALHAGCAARPRPSSSTTTRRCGRPAWSCSTPAATRRSPPPRCARACGCSPSSQPAAVLLDLKLPDGTGIDVLRELQRQAPGTPVVVISGHGQRRGGGGGDEGRGHRLPGEAGLARAALPRSSTASSTRRCPAARPTPRRWRTARATGWSAAPRPCGGSTSSSRWPRPTQVPRAHLGRERDGQGADRARHPRPVAPPRPALRRDSTARPSRPSSSRARCSGT